MTVLDPHGDHAKITPGEEWRYKPLKEDTEFGKLINPETPGFLLLRPQEEASWPWKVSDDFDMSAPGTYRISFGGRVNYLNAQVCSNTLDVSVGKFER